MTDGPGAARRTATVTVLFCDLAGSTERQSRLGDDAADEFRQKFFGALRDAVERTQGGLPCLNDLRRRFIADPGASLDVAACERQSPPIHFVAGPSS